MTLKAFDTVSHNTILQKIVIIKQKAMKQHSKEVIFEFLNLSSNNQISHKITTLK